MKGQVPYLFPQVQIGPDIPLGNESNFLIRYVVLRWR
jgi:hypothetical protein